MVTPPVQGQGEFGFQARGSHTLSPAVLAEEASCCQLPDMLEAGLGLSPLLAPSLTTTRTRAREEQFGMHFMC